ncbi:hypothetical protein VCUG_00759 [Vavraia culicis subsp. floridensis]|uniref:Uncharacterized protein n=1 Tax=Vavraia culicis (isolate floridensis) TaxID=948595 RepID=L2GWY4_VAVCU|nr:uncharacterized protein VCUG_00759 [Vavraia culicis subsp. floridensis]ELA47798.1 hypothetical protein VCUG_00759 [Vavraia culicis subsp. floridensis]
MYILCILVGIGAITEKHVDQILNDVAEKVQVIHQQVELVTSSIPAMKRIRRGFNAMPKSVCTSKNLFSFHFDKFQASCIDLDEYFLAFEYFLGFLPYLVGIVKMSGINKEKIDNTINLKAMKSHMKDKMTFKEYISVTYSDTEKLKRFQAHLLESLKKIRSIITNFDYLYKRIENGVTVDLCLLKALCHFHYCDHCNSLPFSNKCFRRVPGTQTKKQTTS